MSYSPSLRSHFVSARFLEGLNGGPFTLNTSRVRRKHCLLDGWCSLGVHNLSSPSMWKAYSSKAHLPVGKFQQSIRFLNSDRDEGIGSHTIRLVDPVTNAPSERSLTSILASMDRKKYFLIRISASIDTGPPLCKMVPKQDIYEIERKKQIAAHNADYTRKGNNKPKKGQAGMPNTKILELGWSIQLGDLRVRLRKLREFLEKARKVEIAVQNKKRARTVSVEDAETLIGHIRQVADDCSGVITKEEGTPGNTWRVLIEPPATAKERVEEEKFIRQAAKEASKGSKKKIESN